MQMQTDDNFTYSYNLWKLLSIFIFLFDRLEATICYWISICKKNKIIEWELSVKMKVKQQMQAIRGAWILLNIKCSFASYNFCKYWLQFISTASLHTPFLSFLRCLLVILAGDTKRFLKSSTEEWSLEILHQFKTTSLQLLEKCTAKYLLSNELGHNTLRNDRENKYVTAMDYR